MAGKQSFFLTGANAKIRVNGVLLAFATNVSYRVQVIHEDPRILGMYEGHSLEPVAYKVSGSFSVIRYVADVSDRVAAPSGVTDRGNGPGYWSKQGNFITENVGMRPNAREFFNPKLFDRHSAIEIEIVQKTAGGDASVAKIKGAKLTMADFNISSKKSAAMHNFNFEALYVDEDSFRTTFSGLGQQFQ